MARSSTLLKLLKGWKARARALKIEIHALLVVAYAASPIDLIPDFILVLGYLDDLILLPLGIVLAVRLISLEVLNEARQTASQTQGRVLG